MPDEKQVEAAANVLGERFRLAASWIDDVRAVLDAAEKLGPVGAPRGFEVTEELRSVFLRRYSDVTQNHGKHGDAVAEGLRAVSAELARQAGSEPERAVSTAAHHLLMAAKHAEEFGAAEVTVHASLIRAALDEPERAAGPFVLSPEEERVLRACHGMPGDFEVICGAIRRARETLGPTEREEELERQIAAQRKEAAEAKELCRVRGLEIEEQQEELVALRKQAQPAPEPARDLLSADERECVEYARVYFTRFEGPGEHCVWDVFSALDRLAPVAPPADPLQALLADMRADVAEDCLSPNMAEYAKRLEAIIAARKENPTNG